MEDSPSNQAYTSKNAVCFRTALDTFTGYGLHALQIIRYLISTGVQVKIYPTKIRQRFVRLPSHILKLVNREMPNEPWELVLHQRGFSPTVGKRTLWFTMWESSRLPLDFVLNLNRADCVVVPCQWNAGFFRESGVKCPICIVPLGIDNQVFFPTPMEMDGPCVFGTGGRTVANKTRKGIEDVVKAFQLAFPKEKDVELRIKTFPGNPLPLVLDSRIRVVAKYFSECEMASWFGSLTCYVSGSKGEAWGLFQHQALASGRPLISVCYGGISEFFTEKMGYVVPHKIAPANGRFKGRGVWAYPDIELMAEYMRAVYLNREDARMRGIQGSLATSALTWAESNRKLIAVMSNLGMI